MALLIGNCGLPKFEVWLKLGNWEDNENHFKIAYVAYVNVNQPSKFLNEFIQYLDNYSDMEMVEPSDNTSNALKSIHICGIDYYPK